MTEKDALITINTQLSTMEKKIQELFKKKTPKEVIKQRKGAGGKMFPYIPIAYTLSELDRVFGIFWEFLVDETRKTDKQIIVRGRLIIKSPNGFSISRPGVGRATIKFYQGTKDPVDEGNDEKAATSDAIKKAASLFGVAADIYYKELEKYEEVPDEIDKDQEQKQQTMSRYFVVAAERGFDAEEAKGKIKTAFKVEHMDLLSTGQLEHGIELMIKKYPIKSGKPEPIEMAKATLPEEKYNSESLPWETETSDETDTMTYFCQGSKHFDPDTHKMVAPTTVAKIGGWCSEDCQDTYYRNDKEESKQSRFEDFLKKGKDAGQIAEQQKLD